MEQTKILIEIIEGDQLKLEIMGNHQTLVFMLTQVLEKSTQLNEILEDTAMLLMVKDIKKEADKRKDDLLKSNLN